MYYDYVALSQRWREKAELFPQHGHEAIARTYEACSAELEAAVSEGEEQLCDLQAAARESRFSRDHPRWKGGPCA